MYDSGGSFLFRGQYAIHNIFCGVPQGRWQLGEKLNSITYLFFCTQQNGELSWSSLTTSQSTEQSTESLNSNSHNFLIIGQICFKISPLSSFLFLLSYKLSYRSRGII